MKNENDKNKSIIFIIFIMLAINGYQFLSTLGSNLPILGLLFNMIIFLTLIIILLHPNYFFILTNEKKGNK